MKGKNKIQKIKIGWDDGYARQKPPIRIDYNKYHHYWHMYQILKRFIKRGSLVLECGCGLNNSTTGLDLSKRNLQTQGVTQFTLDGTLELFSERLPRRIAIFDRLIEELGCMCERILGPAIAALSEDGRFAATPNFLDDEAGLARFPGPRAAGGRGRRTGTGVGPAG